MASSLLTGVSGLIAHQQMLNVVGNNIANINTTAYKAQQSLFADLMYENFKPAANSEQENTGGTNPSQLGNGVRVNSITRHFSQGSVDLTGGEYDFAIQGRGFFVVSAAGKEQYTRAGAFGLDFQNTLVDPATGAKVQRFGTAGEGSIDSPSFQTPGDTSINIPIGAIISGEATKVVEVKGNLSSDAASPTTAILLTPQFLAQKPTETDSYPAKPETLLNDLVANQKDYGRGDRIRISGQDHNGDAVDKEIEVNAETTVQDFLDSINVHLVGSEATLTADGSIQIKANESGASLLNLSIKDVENFGGGTTFAEHTLEVEQQGLNPGTYSKDIEVFDTLGGEHTVTLTFERRPDFHVWDVTATLPSGDGEVIDGQISDVTFDEKGNFVQVFGTGTADSNLTIKFDGLETPQEFSINFSKEGMSQKADTSELEFDQDGLEPGKIVTVSVGLDGLISGVSSNGRVIPIAQLAIATFENEQGLTGAGSNYFDVSLNSGEAQLGAALSGSKGSVTGGALEGSNVDVAFEFTRLIIAQRGFSANARTITVSDQMLEELTNMIR